MNERSDLPGAGSEGEPPKGEGLSVDEKFARLAAEFDGSQIEGPAVKEESARTRQLRAQWSKNPPQATPWRADGPSALGPSGSGPSEPGWPAADRWPRKPRRSLRSRAVLSAKILCLVALVGLIAYGFRPRPHTVFPVNATPAGTEAPWAVSGGVPESPSPSQSFTNPDDAYFVGSPALAWADNESGFTLPAAAALDGVSRSEVADGYRLLEEVMAAGNLDATVLNGGSITDYRKLLDPESESYADVSAWLAHPTAQHDPLLFVTRFNPAKTRLLGHTVKVHGSMSEQKGTQAHSVLLTADYLFVYAVGPPSGDADEDTRVVMHRSVQIEVVDPGYGYEMTAGKAWLSDYSYSSANSDCYDYSGFVDPDFGDSAGVPDATGTVDPYATGDLLTASPDSTSTAALCQAVGHV